MWLKGFDAVMQWVSFFFRYIYVEVYHKSVIETHLSHLLGSSVKK